MFGRRQIEQTVIIFSWRLVRWGWILVVRNHCEKGEQLYFDYCNYLLIICNYLLIICNYLLIICDDFNADYLINYLHYSNLIALILIIC